MNCKLLFEDWGTIDYNEAYAKQIDYLKRNIELKEQGLDTFNKIIFVEHPNVFTIGKHGDISNLKANEEFLKKIDAKFVHTDRGGDITYHGPGQLVVYAVLDLDNFGLFVRSYVETLEEIIIDMLKVFNIQAVRLEGAPGVWLTDRNIPEKICAIGIRIIKNITMHGVALNVNTNLSYFNFINPCGYTDKGVSSLAKELNKNIEMTEVKKIIKQKFEKFLICKG